MKSSDKAWRSKLSDTLNSMGYMSTDSEPDVWKKRSTTYNGTAYYNYMLVYINDVLHLTKDAQ